MAVIGKVQRVKEKSTSFGTMYDIQVEGKWYGCGKQKPDCNEGDLVKFSTRQNGNYTNVQGSVEVMERGTSAPQSHSGPSSDRQQRIEYQNSRNVAAAILPSLIAAMPEEARPTSPEDVMALLRDVAWDLMDDMAALDEALAGREQ